MSRPGPQPRPRPRVEVAIGELVVHGFAVHDPGGFGDAVAGSLSRLVGERGLPPGPTGARAEPAPVTVTVARGAPPARLAEQVAEAVWRSLA